MSTSACAAEPRPARRSVEKWLNETFRVELTDGRMIVGTFVSTDRDANIILTRSLEYWKDDESGTTRNIGMVMVARRHIVRIWHVPTRKAPLLPPDEHAHLPVENADLEHKEE